MSDIMLILTCVSQCLDTTTLRHYVGVGRRCQGVYFQQQARKTHDALVPLAKGVSTLERGILPLAAGLHAWLMIMRRMSCSKTAKRVKGECKPLFMPW
jgi:hypothetical protein